MDPQMELHGPARARCERGAQGAAVERKVRRHDFPKQDAFMAFLFLLPNSLGFFLFGVFQLLYCFGLSFFEWTGTRPPHFVGLSNFGRLLFDDVMFWRTLRNTGYFVGATVPLTVLLALILALGLNQKLPGKALLRGAFFLPVIAAPAATALIWRWLYNLDYGVINYVLASAHLPRPGWVSDLQWAMPAVIIMAVWQGVGFNLVIFLAGLQDIPSFLYEAAEIDGAGKWQRFLNITLPMLSPTMFLVIIMAVITSFQVFDQTFVLTGGGPGGVTTTIVLYVYQNGFKWFRMGYASALAWVLFLIVLALTELQVRLQGKWVHYD